MSVLIEDKIYWLYWILLMILRCNIIQAGKVSDSHSSFMQNDVQNVRLIFFSWTTFCKIYYKVLANELLKSY